jgi:hypothetical protein
LTPVPPNFARCGSIWCSPFRRDARFLKLLSVAISRQLGPAQVDGSLDFTNAWLTLYSGGVWSNDAPNAIRT